jgi:excisionase family DNA binding protein
MEGAVANQKHRTYEISIGEPRPLYPWTIQPRPESRVAQTIELFASKVAERVEEKVIERLQHMPPQIQPALLSVRDAATYLGRTEQAIQHLIFSQELPVVRVGRRVHLDRRDLDAWIEKNKY